VWISDAVHAFTGILLMLSTYLALKDADNRHMLRTLLALLLIMIALLVREETLAFGPVIVLAILMKLRQTAYLSVVNERDTSRGYTFQPDREVRFNLLHVSSLSRISVIIQRNSLRTILAYFIGVTFLSAIFLLIRSRFTAGPPEELDLNGWVQNITFVMNLTGSDPYEWLLFIVLGVLTGMSFYAISAEARWRAGLWLAFAAITASSGVVLARANTVFIPISFFGLYLATVLCEFAGRRLVKVVPCALLAAALLWWSASKNMLEQENGHPLSPSYLQSAVDFEWGDFKEATIPQVRRDSIQRQLAALGIRKLRDFKEFRKRVRDSGVDRPNDAGKPFVPRSEFVGD